MSAIGLTAASLLLAAGCPTPRTSKDKTPAKGLAKDPPEKGAHGGALAEWDESDETHAEFTVDHDKKQATVYVLDGEAKKAVPIPAESLTLSLTNTKPPVEITLKADPQEGDPKGQASRFTGTHEALGKEMEFEGKISGETGGGLS